MLATGYLGVGYGNRAQRAIAWSSDNKWIAYLGLSTRSFRNVLCRLPAGRAGLSSAIPNASTSGISWSPDGAFLVFNTSQRTEDTEVVRVDLTLRTPKFAEDQFRDLFKEEPARNRPGGRRTETGLPQAETPPGPTPGNGKRGEVKPVEIVFDDIRRRVSVLPVGSNFSSQGISAGWRLASAQW